MYTPKHFAAADPAASQLLRDFPFATLLAPGQLSISHLPLLLENNTLLGHMARANPQWRHFQENPKALVIFQGPHAYISPTWYRSGRDVPTWNYCVAHVHGRVKLVEDFTGLTTILRKTTERFEQSRPNPWEFELPDDLPSPETLGRAIIGFEISIETIDAKFKLNQNRSAIDREGVIEGLASCNDDMSRQIREMMRKQLV